MALTSKLEAIGDAIREQTGTTAKLSLDNMATTISEIEKPNDGVLTIKQGDVTKGTFTANAKDNVEIALDEVNDATLTIKQEGETLSTFSANAKTNIEVDIKHATGAGNNHIPAGGATGDYLAYASNGTATWSATSDIVKDYAKLESPTFTGTPTAPTAEAKTSTTQLATTEFVTSADTALLVDTPLTGTPTAPTATAGTNTTQLATTAYVMEALKPVTVYDGTGEEYLTAKSSRINISNVAITKTGYYYLTDVTFTFNPTAKASYDANEWFNIITIQEKYRDLIHSYISFGIIHDTVTNGLMGALVSMASSGAGYTVSFPVAKTVDSTTIWHAQFSFIGKASS